MRLLAIDVGTTAVKAAIVDGDGLATVVEESVGISTPHPGWVEQDTEEWWTATVRATRRLKRRQDMPEQQTYRHHYRRLRRQKAQSHLHRRRLHLRRFRRPRRRR